MNYILILFFVFLALSPLAILNNATFIISLVKGAMIGGLYNRDVYEEEEVVEHTMQFCFIFITFTMIWEKPLS
tara:strand:+ start:905 stop:1123 length:219 start_codon:yes stop_codon:yes gene_type:complete